MDQRAINAHDRQTPETPARTAGEPPVAVRLRVRGRVQGVGFRPFVARIAVACRLAGWVKNTPEGVIAHIEGAPRDLADFRRRMHRDAPPAAEIHQVHEQAVDPCFDSDFQVLESEATGTAVLVTITPDLAICHRCLAEFVDPTDRRFGYALSGCTDCGPRFTQLKAPPFDRDRTAMAVFRPCADCQNEYVSPANRRFHAQNIACARCGPSVWNEEAGGAEDTIDHAGDDLSVLARAGEWLREGKIVAVKGIGGFHLLCDATSRCRPASPRTKAARG